MDEAVVKEAVKPRLLLQAQQTPTKNMAPQSSDH
jgi:hypothetical protein